MSFPVPEGLQNLLQDFTVSVLRENPSDLVEYAAQYFGEMVEKRGGGGTLPGLGAFRAGKSITFENGGNSDSDDDYIMEPPAKDKLLRRTSVSAERYDPENDPDDDEPKVVHSKTDDQRKRLKDAVKNILLFKSLDAEQMSEVIDAMFERQTKEGDCIIKEGDDGDNFYIIDSGKYDIFKRQANDGSDLKVGAYDGTGSFGELALMYNQPRAATIITSVPGSIWALDRSTFRRIVLKNAFMKRKMYEELIESVPLFSELTMYERMNLADALTTRRFNDGDLIINQGDSADGMFFIESGEVKVIMRTARVQRTNDEEAEVNRLGTGKYFGELALLTSKPRAASVYAVGETKCAFVDVEAFERLLGPCKEIMSRNIHEYQKQLNEAFGHPVDMSDLR